MEDNRESSHDSVEILEQQPAKRRRIALACGSCRDRKTRCDGQKPVCGPCTKRGNADSECAYAVLAGSAKRQSEQEYISCLQQEIRDLRQALTSRQNRESAPLVPQIRTTAFSVSPGRAPAPTSTLPQSLQSAHQYDPRRIPAPQDGSTYPDPSSILPYSVQGDASPLPVLSNPQSSTHPVADVNPRSDVGSKRQTTSSRHGVSPRVESAAQNTEMTPVNAMGAATSIWSSSSRNREFFGQSSIVSLLEQVAHPVLQASSYAAESTSARSDIPAPRRGLGDRANEPTLRFDGREGSLSGLLGAQYSLPPRDVADELFNNYYANVHIFYPWTHPARVRKTYESIWALQDNQPQEPAESFEVGLGSPCPQRIFFLALNAMFALGLQFSRFDAAEKEDASKMFYRRMEELVNMELVGGNSLAHVQAFLLVGQYLLCTQYPSRCWNVSGLACRMAMGLGLQTKTYPEGLLPIEVEIRRRVWYGCAQMDMFISMMLGRKPSTSMNLEVPLPTPVDDEVLERVGSPNSHTKDDPSINAFMVENIRLTRILGNILDVLYETTPKDPNRHLPLRLQGSDLNCEDFNAIASLDGQLNRFTKELPAFLQQNEFEPMQSRDRRLVRQTEVLHARILHLRILLYRPSLSIYCSDASSLKQRMHSGTADNVRSASPLDSTFIKSMRLPCAVACVQTTCDLVKLMETAIMRNTTGAWWFSVFYLVTCGTILLLAQSSSQLEPHLAQQNLDVAWKSCIRTLQHISGRHSRVEGYIELLVALKERMMHVDRNPLQTASPHMPAQTSQFHDHTPPVDSTVPDTTPRPVWGSGASTDRRGDIAGDRHVRSEGQANGFSMLENFGFGLNSFIDPSLYDGSTGLPPGFMMDDPATRAFIPTFI